MPILSKLIEKYAQVNSLRGLNLGVCLHITKETSVLVLGLKESGANVSLCSANPLSTKTDIKDFLEDSGICIYAENNDRLDSFYLNMDKVLNTKPQIITDDGGELHKKAIVKKHPIQGGTEETTSGVNRLRAMSNIPYPVIAVNQSVTKHLFDNTFGTGQSVIEAIIQTTSVLIATKRIVVCGYGWVGKGVSKFARSIGAKVSVTEIDPVKAMEAYLDGFEVAKLEKLLSHNDIFISCTGQINVIGRRDFGYLKDGAILCNAGHFDVEIDVKALDELDPDFYEPVPGVTCYKIGEVIEEKKYYCLQEVG